MADEAPITAAPAADATAAPAPAVTEAAAPVAAPVVAETAPEPAAADWRSSITDPDAKEFASRLATPADAVKVALDFRKINSGMIKVPGANATPEDKAKFNKAIGVPETVEGYKFDLGREPTEADKAIQSGLAKIAFENGVPANAMGALTKAVADMAATQQAEANRVALQAREASEAALRKEWGADYEANKNCASRAVAAFGETKTHPQLLDLLNKTVDGMKLGDHPEMVRMLGNIGRRMGEGEFIGAVGGNERQSLHAEMNELMRANPPGTDKYKQPAVQARIQAITQALSGNGGIVGAAGRSA